MNKFLHKFLIISGLAVPFVLLQFILGVICRAFNLLPEVKEENENVQR